MNKSETKSDSEKILELVLWLSLMAFSIPTSIFRAFVLTKLWLWFVVVQFGVSPLSLAVAMGLDLIWGVMRATYRKDPSGLEETFKRILFRDITCPASGLLVGWIIQMFIK